ncbi:nucleoside triphosphatase YtkD [Listeria sp. FSL L7-0091]|uniref:Nucleoside triphosphatase YtkD n=1 Tax=Listeria farberi TaxID=2713500 RepID=A0A7X0ZGW9_9LIST|nr:nucleoside triphosphatase YtkD [Listeria farberi]MBC1373933.1 nucleoside triphosphatase YtkD [Listeria farberi]MBC1381415.1 nucleoside triphosphatase YtkD [Listeria farberi]MBC2262587.1 nucleoside triphosphatase YtkD [Listeria farberi]MBC2267624.1 nucleoside triphosphatase YtkD [Listeria farberi]MBC2287085.1 nucleoside triphosphatase YtkD [Listeria farberi]
MFIYTDTLGNKVTIYFEKQQKNPDDVLIIPKIDGSWLFTEHKIRGLEFPGGKGEPGETSIEAARRELMEETGAVSDTFDFVADYLVESKERIFTKRVYIAKVVSIMEQPNYLETNGPVVLKGTLSKFILQPAFSFFMRDAGMVQIVKQAEQILDDKN